MSSNPEAGESFSGYLRELGVRELAPATSPFDPGVAPVVLQSHLEQSAHLMRSLKISMACWIVAEESATRAKVAAAHAAGVRVSTGGGPFEVAVAQGRLPAYLDLCADVGFDAIECGSGFTDPAVSPHGVVEMAADRGLEVEYELGKKHGGAFASDELPALLAEGNRWIEAGARWLVVEARESAVGVGLFDGAGRLDTSLAEQVVDAFGLDAVVFEAPSKASQFAMLDHLGPRVRLGNVPLSELLRVEIYRRGLHSDAFSNPRLRPKTPSQHSEVLSS
jgi:phosphosulfolactate synthase